MKSFRKNYGIFHSQNSTVRTQYDEVNEKTARYLLFVFHADNPFCKGNLHHLDQISLNQNDVRSTEVFIFVVAKRN